MRPGAAVAGSAVFARAKQRGTLVVGVPRSFAPRVLQKEKAGEKYTGFDVEIATMIGASLGFDAEHVKIDAGPAFDSSGHWAADVDVRLGVLGDEPTDGLYEKTGPYYRNSNALLVRRDNPLTDPDDQLAGKSVCMLGVTDPEAEEAFKSAHPGAQVQQITDTAPCVMSVRSMGSDAAWGSDLLLRGFAAENPQELKVVGAPTKTYALSAAVPAGEKALSEAISAAIAGHRDNGDIEAAYKATLGPSGLPMPALR